MDFKKHHNATVEIARATQKGEPVIVEVMGCSWSVTCTELTHSSNEWGPPRITLEPVLGAPTVDKPAGGSPLELEGLKFTADSRGIKLQGPAHTRIPYGLTWKAAAKLVAWLCVEVDKHRAPVAPTESPALPRQWLARVDDLSPEALTAAVWSGEGLPPVGCACECHIRADGFEKCSIVAHVPHKSGLAAILVYDDGQDWDWTADAECFRPLRTAEQLAAEAREAAIAQIIKAAGISESAFTDDPEAYAWAAALHDAGYGRAGV